MTDGTVNADAFNAFEAAGWEHQVAGYEEFFGPITTRLVEPLLDAAGVGPGVRVLDVASGPGHGAAMAVERGASVIGVDVAEGMLALARHFHPSLDFRFGDAEALPFPDGSFDAVVANFVMLHVGRPEQAAAEFARVLAPDGRAADGLGRPGEPAFVGVLVEAVAAAGASPPQDIPAGPPIFRFSDDEEFAGPPPRPAVRGRPSRRSSSPSTRRPPTRSGRACSAGPSESPRSSAVRRARCESGSATPSTQFVQQYEVDGGLEHPVSVKLASGRKP